MVKASISMIFAIFLGCSASAFPSVKEQKSDRKWWKEAVVYQIYPRSFKDSNGDGVGDLRGIIEKLDYIKSLGVDVVWLNPIFPSPNDDNGYDISDYRGIMKEFGTMEDFDALLKGLHRRKIRLVLDLVANHSSDEHFWFQEARKSRDNPYRNYYHWWDAEKGTPPFRRSFFDVNNDAWKYDEKTNSYYLHYYSQKQPDLNWENPKLRNEMYAIMRFWLDKGIDGFRMDVIPFISKDTTFPNMPEEKRTQLGSRAFYAKGPYLHDYLQEMNREVLSKYDVMSVGEGSGVSVDDVEKYIDPNRKELNMLYHFEGRNIPYIKAKVPLPIPNFSLKEFKAVYSKWDETFHKNGWGTIYLGNHDVPRMVSRWGNDSAEFRELSSKMLTTFILTMSGTPYYFAGDEIGMSNIKFDNFDDYRDIKTVNRVIDLKTNGGDLQSYLEDQKIISRDNARTPFQWNNSKNAGFTVGTPWLKINPDYKIVNADANERDPQSVLNYFKRLMKLRKSEKTLIYGKYKIIDQENEKIYAYTREMNGTKLLILLNFTNSEALIETDLNLRGAKILLGNYPNTARIGKLRPYEAMVLKLTKQLPL